MEEGEGRGADCERFEAGARPNGAPLEEDELVYGIYKNQYFFTPQSFIRKVPEGFERIRWREIKSCSSKHGDGKKLADLALIDGRQVQVRIGDFGKGWQGRISQLFHQLIEKHGAAATFGPPLLTPNEFFSAGPHPGDFLPNLQLQMTLVQAKDALRQLEQVPGVSQVYLHIAEIEAGSPVADAIVVCGTASLEVLEEFASSHGANGVLEAAEGIKRKVGALSPGQRVWHLVWD